MTKTIANPGTIIHGTGREADLVDAFSTELESLWPEKMKAIREEYADIYAMADAKGWEETAKKHLDDMGYLIHERLYGALDECAPEGHYFGAHPGDGSDMGFWPNEDE